MSSRVSISGRARPHEKVQPIIDGLETSKCPEALDIDQPDETEISCISRKEDLVGREKLDKRMCVARWRWSTDVCQGAASRYQARERYEDRRTGGREVVIE